MTSEETHVFTVMVIESLVFLHLSLLYERGNFKLTLQVNHDSMVTNAEMRYIFVMIVRYGVEEACPKYLTGIATWSIKYAERSL